MTYADQGFATIFDDGFASAYIKDLQGCQKRAILMVGRGEESQSVPCTGDKATLIAFADAARQRLENDAKEYGIPGADSIELASAALKKYLE